MASYVDAAREGDGGGIPWDEPLGLVNVLNAPAVVRTNEWKDVGLELGVEKHVLDRIDRECQGLINDCKREMFYCWLKNGLQPSWDKVSRAVNTVRRRLDGASHQLSSTVSTTRADVLGKPLTLILPKPLPWLCLLHPLPVCKYGVRRPERFHLIQ